MRPRLTLPFLAGLVPRIIQPVDQFATLGFQDFEVRHLPFRYPVGRPLPWDARKRTGKRTLWSGLKGQHSTELMKRRPTWVQLKVTSELGWWPIKGKCLNDGLDQVRRGSMDGWTVKEINEGLITLSERLSGLNDWVNDDLKVTFDSTNGWFEGW